MSQTLTKKAKRTVGTKTYCRHDVAHRSRPVRAEGPIRTELVQRIKRQLEEGSYMSDEKWEIALDRLFVELTSN